MSDKRCRSGFTLLELAAVLAVGSMVAAALAPMSHRARSTSRGMSSVDNLMQIGQVAGMYGLDNADRIPGYNWAGPEPGASLRTEHDIGGGVIIRAASDAQAASAQQAEILRRRTGRFGQVADAIEYDDARLPHQRFSHLILMDYLDRPFPDQLFIDPRDASLLAWSSDPLNYQSGSTVPYANGFPNGYDQSLSWSRSNVRNRWAFSSSYLPTTSSWQADGRNEPVYHPVSNTPHLLGNNASGPGGRVELSDGRDFLEVQFPANKVYFFEEFSRDQPRSAYFAYDAARPNKLMFDGSINTERTGAANPGWNADRGKFRWLQTYVPLDSFPTPLGGLGDSRIWDQRYRWTLGGLQGIDYATPIRAGGTNVRRR